MGHALTCSGPVLPNQVSVAPEDVNAPSVTSTLPPLKCSFELRPIVKACVGPQVCSDRPPDPIFISGGDLSSKEKEPAPNVHIAVSVACHSRQTCGTDESVLSNDVSCFSKICRQTISISEESILSNGASHVSKANTPSSNRQKAAVMKSTVTMENSSKRSKNNKQSRAKKKSKKILNVLLPISISTQCEAVYNTLCRDAVVFVDGGAHPNPPIQPILPPSTNKTNKRVHILSIRYGELRIINSHLFQPMKGLRYSPPLSSPSQVILVPRRIVLEQSCKKITLTTSLCEALEAVEDNMRTSQERGGSKFVIREKCDKYVCVGTQTCRASPGIRSMHYALERTPPQHQKRIIRYFRQVEHLFMQFVGTEEIRLVKEAIDLVEAKTFKIADSSSTQRSSSTCIYGAFAFGKNVYLNCHWDKDFTYCATSIHMKKQYSESQDVVAYFAFPRLGFVIPMRPGDILFFNPKEPHCVSSRCNNHDNIYCMSLYLKSDNIGKNDNSLPLTDNQEELFRKYNKV